MNTGRASDALVFACDKARRLRHRLEFGFAKTSRLPSLRKQCGSPLLIPLKLIQAFQAETSIIVVILQ